MLRRLFTLALLFAATLLVAPVSQPASGAERGAAAGSDQPFVDVIEVGGLIDPVMVRFIEESIDKAAEDGAQVLVIQLDSPGTTISETDQLALLERIGLDHDVPIAVWVGPSRSRARGFAAQIADAADIVGVAPGTRLGVAEALNSGRALREGKAQINAPVLGLFVTQLDGRTVDGKVLDTAKQLTRDGKPLLQPHGVRFAKLDAMPRLLHTVTNPTVAYLLLVIGLALMVFEFYTGGIGIAAAVAIASVGLSSYGLGNLPTRPIGLVLIALAMLGFAIDVQAGTPRFWTGVGTVSLVAGSMLLYAGSQKVPIYWIAVMCVMVVVFMVAGMPTMVRTRFATPTIGREAMIGEQGEARTTVDPEGVVLVRGAPWRARTNRATPIAEGAPIRVSAIDGLLLEVEPLEGAARDAGH